MAHAPTPTSAFDQPMDLAFGALTDKVEDRYDRSFLRRLFSFASCRGVDPDGVD
jgi:hypothetical protein